MDRELTPDEITELLPAYALDAVDDDERAAIDAYLDAHPDERATVAEFQVTASMLAHTGGPPPEGVWERLESMISTTPPPLRVVPPAVLLPPSAPAGETARPDQRWRWLAAAAAVVALVFGGLWLVDRGDGGGGAAGDTAALAATEATAPGARHATLTNDDGTELATAVVTSDGAGYVTSELPPAPAGHTYQLWGITRTGTISLGVLGRDPGTVAFHAAGPTTSLAITTEVVGGVPVSHNAPDAVGDIA
ncbi:MAG TPA: anti-sigma factor [Acidimicrobiia bacterium]|nr:anti-sigma factor [Acidimicrobiia bacterium]